MTAASPPDVVAHADWGLDPRKRQVAVATRRPGDAAGPARYRIVSVAAAPAGDLFAKLQARYRVAAYLIGFDFTLGLPRAYAAAAGVPDFPAFLSRIGSPPWTEFDQVAVRADEISLRRPFYPHRPGGTRRAQLQDALGLSAQQLRRRCDGTDAETLFWTLGGKQAGKSSLHGWRMIRQARAGGADLALWPFDGSLPELLARGGIVVAEAYPREFYQYIGAPPAARWSKRRRADRLLCIPALLAWADRLGVSWDAAVGQRVTDGCDSGPTGEDEFDAVIGVLGMISVLTGAVPPGVPADDQAVLETEGWILGRAAGPTVGLNGAE
jgi:hypothetical protein